jgi:hypothetical protein
MIRARSSGGLGALRMNIVNGGANQVRPDGSFQLTNVPPGDYVLDVQQRPQNIRGLQDINLSQLEFASMPVSVQETSTISPSSPLGRDGVGRYLPGQSTPKTTQAMQVIAVPPSGGPSPMGCCSTPRRWRRTSRTGQHIRASRHRGPQIFACKASQRAGC